MLRQEEYRKTISRRGNKQIIYQRLKEDKPGRKQIRGQEEVFIVRVPSTKNKPKIYFKTLNTRSKYKPTGETCTQPTRDQGLSDKLWTANEGNTD